MKKLAHRFQWWLFHSAVFIAVADAASAANPTKPIVINARTVLVEHFDGWGTSLCWWAHVIGGFTNREAYADLAFKQLGLNIVRYNIGGGENPARRNTLDFRARIPSFESEPGKWNWNTDINQRWMLRAAVARGANHVVAFANSPPYWMTYSGSVTGSTNGNTDNLRPEFETTFAKYLATVTSNLTVLDGVRFDTVAPMNEPGANWWKLGQHQEGTHMSVEQQQRVVKQLRKALDQAGVKATIVGSEDNDEHSTWKSVSSYDPETLADISQITTHTYEANAPDQLRELAEQTGKPLWVSEYGDGDDSGMRLARRIRDDIVKMHAQAWIYWQFADNNGSWGLVFNRLDGRDTSYQLTRKFYVMAQFSRFIRPGSKIVEATDNNSLAAYEPARQQLVIVSVNDSFTSKPFAYQLNGLTITERQVSLYQTSPHENLAAKPPIGLTERGFVATLPPQSVTTFILSNTKLD